MKEINDKEYFNSVEISERFHNRITTEEIIVYFEKGKIKGKKIDNEWFASQKAIEDFIDEVLLKERTLTVGPYKIDLSNIKLDGRILDIGGGGEGIIGQFKGEQVVSIDPNKKELEESPSTRDLKIVMDAKELKFLDNSFETITAFFTFMYIPVNDHKKIFQEIYRVLKANGEFSLWDVIIPKNINENRDIYVIKLEVKFNDELIETGYGVLWNKEQDMNYYINLGKNTGFEILKSNVENETFFLRFRKK
ncbi:MAG: methyltransferase domain-containing protein [Promethearchaeota archaeon]